MHSPVSQLRRHPQFHSQFLEHDRDVLVWLPPGYEGSTGVLRPSDDGSTDVRFPVLYMHDGQNLFEPETAFNKGEHWRVGETATELIEAGRIEPLIVVGIYTPGRPGFTSTRRPTMRNSAAASGRLRPDDHRRAQAADRSHLSNAGRSRQTGMPDHRSAGWCRCTWRSITRDFRPRRGVVAVGLVGSQDGAENHPRSESQAEARLWVDMGTAEGAAD